MDDRSVAAPSPASRRDSAAGPEPDMDRFVDFLRAVSIVVVCVGHWLVIAPEYQDGELVVPEILLLIPWTQWLTLGMQVMPLFFLAGGSTAAHSWTRRKRESAEWAHSRALRLLVPTALYVGIAIPILALAGALGLNAGIRADVGWLLASHFWFLPVYLVVSTLTPWLFAAHIRWGSADRARAARAAGPAGCLGESSRDLGIEYDRVPVELRPGCHGGDAVVVDRNRAGVHCRFGRMVVAAFRVAHCAGRRDDGRAGSCPARAESVRRCCLPGCRQ
ncbi:acyltransferase [Nocardia sp. NPDC060259]|uniref:acyltransferase family protein n=1 Tax=Nocardia sp. NPDC060259 TaxID=3347088 RepID=UPI0036503275